MATDTSKITTAANELGDGLAKGGTAAKTLGTEIANALKSLDSRVATLEAGGSNPNPPDPNPDHPYEDFTKGYTKHSSGTVTFSDSNHTVKCSVTNGDHSDWDANCDFAGLSGQTHFPWGSTYHLDFYMRLEPGAAFTGRWVILGEIHNHDGELGRGTSPPFSIHCDKEIMQISCIWGDKASGNDHWFYPWKDSAKMARGRDYHMQIDIKFGKPGFLKIKRDGVVIVDYTGNLGYGASTYWMPDIYRSNTNPTTTETTAVVFSKMQLW